MPNYMVTYRGTDKKPCDNKLKTSRLLEDIGYNMHNASPENQNPQEFVALWVESEKSLEKDYVVNTFNIDPERFIFIEYDPDMGAEGVLDKLYALMSAVPVDMVVINSLKCLTPKKIIEDDLNSQTPGIAARRQRRSILVREC